MLNNITEIKNKCSQVPVTGLSRRRTDDGLLMSAKNLYKSSSLSLSPSCSATETPSIHLVRETIHHANTLPSAEHKTHTKKKSRSDLFEEIGDSESGWPEACEVAHVLSYTHPLKTFLLPLIPCPLTLCKE